MFGVFEGSLQSTWFAHEVKKHRLGLTFHRKQVGSLWCALPWVAVMWKADCPTILHAVLCWVLGERGNTMRYIGPSFPVVTPYGMLGRTEEITVPFSAFYQIWKGGSETDLGLASLKSFWATTDASSKSCWFELQI